MKGPLLAVLLALTLSGCATSENDLGDPFEPANRRTQASFLWIDDHVLHPVSLAYAGSVPDNVRRAIHNALTNLALPTVILNDLLQGNPDRSAAALGRLVINSTAGLGGLFDVAGELDLKPHEADFGQTFGVWGLGEGPYLFLPFFGPSNPRDAVGIALGILTNPAMLLSGDEAAMMIGSEMAATAIDRRSARGQALDRMRAESFDFYATLREAYRENRAYRIEQARQGR